MKKQLTILFLFVFNSLFVWSQSSFIKTTEPCSVELMKKTPGEWFKVRENDFYHATPNAQQRQEMLKRLTTFHNMVYNLYPSPIAFDAEPFYETHDRMFASQLKIEHSANRMEGIEINGTPTLNYAYYAKFCGYYCSNNANEIMRGRGCEAGTSVSVNVNDIGVFFKSFSLDNDYLEIMLIDKRPIKMLPALVGTWKGYDCYAPEKGLSNKMILLHRNDMLPYTPVTRKEYLDRCMQCLKIFFDKQVRALANPEGLASLMDKKELEEQVKKMKKTRDDVFKYYQDEIDATTNAGLLDSPAIVLGVLNMFYGAPIFSTLAEGGNMLVTENPVYFKKELPKYIPQLMVFSTWPCKCGLDPSLDPYKLFDENFPIEKLQSMIDK